MNCFSFIFFVALTKAFDRVLRGLDFGFRQGVGESRSDKLAYLMSIGVVEPEAVWILFYLDEFVCAFDQCGVDPKVKAPMAALRTNVCFSRAVRKSVPNELSRKSAACTKFCRHSVCDILGEIWHASLH